MVATKTTKPGKDGTPTPYTQGMATESSAVALTPYTYICEPVGETLISPALDATVAATVTAQGTLLAGVKGQLNMGSVTTASPTYTTGQVSPLNLDTAGSLRVNVITGAGNVAQNSTTAGQVTSLASGAVTTAAPTYTTAQTSPLSLDTTGALRVNVTTGAGNAAQGSTTAGQTTSLSSAAVTTAAPSYSTGQTSPLSLDLAGNLRVVSSGSAAVAQGSTTAGQNGTLNQGAVTAAAPSYTTGQTSPLSIDLAGNLRVNIITGTVTAASSGVITNPTSTLTRPANTTAYVANELIASNPVVVPSFAIATSAGGAILSGLRIRTNVTTGWDNVQLSINLWSAAPTYTGVDNGAYVVATGSAGWIAECTLMLKQFNDGAVGRGAITNANEVALKLVSGTAVFWDLQILTAATPISGQTFIITADLLN